MDTTKLSSVLYHLQQVHATPREYFFSSAAISEVNKFFNKYQAYVRQANEKDFFLGAMLGKFVEIFFRFSAILQAFNTACEDLIDLPVASDLHLSEELHNESAKIISKFHAYTFSIGPEAVQRAITMTEYLGKGKLILATYAVNPCHTFAQMLTKIFAE